MIAIYEKESSQGASSKKLNDFDFQMMFHQLVLSEGKDDVKQVFL